MEKEYNFQPVESIPAYFTYDEVFKGIEKIANEEGYYIVNEKLFHDPGLCHNGKKEIIKKGLSLFFKGEIKYIVEFTGEDIHFKSERGRDFYRTVIKNPKKDILFESYNYHINNPESLSDEEDYSPPMQSQTNLYSNDPLAKKLFEMIKNHYYKK
ncbi:MAG: hypothetical protein QXW97_02635 [Candidatus Pacearchaeota archaeon]